MTMPKIFTDSEGKEFVLIYHNYDDGFTSMPKAVWDELEAQREQSGTL